MAAILSSFIGVGLGVFDYLADLFAEAGLAPALTDPDRGAYVRWLFIYGSCFEPAVVDRYMKREPGSMNETPYASYESLIDLLEATLKQGPYLLGERFTAADLLWGIALHWTTMFGIVEARPAFKRALEDQLKPFRAAEAAYGDAWYASISADVWGA